MSAVPSLLDDLADRRLSASPAIAPFAAQTIDEITATRVPQVVQGLLYGVAVVVGAPNAGKSAFAVDLALHVSAGESFFGLKVRSGPVLYVAAESPGGIVERARAAVREKFADRRLPFYVVRDPPCLGAEDRCDVDLARLVATAESIASMEGETLRLLVIDTVAMALAGSDENSEGMLRLVAAAQTFHQRTGACVLLLHHPSKADANGLRGHSSLSGAADVIVAIGVDGVSDTRTVKVTKSRDGAAGRQIHFKLEPVAQPERDDFGDPVSTIIVRGADAPEVTSRAPTGKAQRTLLRVLCARAEGDRGKVWTLGDLRQIGREIGLSRSTARDAALALVNSGFLVTTVGGHRLQDAVL